MPQLDVTTFASQLFWLGVCFASLYVILSRKVLPRIARTFEQRRVALDEKINSASKFRDEAEALLAKYEAALESAREDAQTKSTAAIQALTTEAIQRKQVYTDKLATRLQEEEQKLFKARKDIDDKLQTMAEDMAARILQKLEDPQS